ncbi:MAG TPA: dATP/dGTP diphosphohydrolase domain-containing protein [Candidatus Saccharimonadales bacterium]|nr:dATP/dGTP diphosphohydrolase domain-containing protein [Candidatus Saccharimonadales bacterium]
MTDFQQFESGAVRDTQEGKIKFELITPTFKKDLAAMLTDKAKHYGDRNWEKGIPTARTFSSLMRHIEALGRGEWLDEESGHPHTVLAAANLMFIHEFHGSEFDTLNELVGPALRNTPSELNYAEAFPTGSLKDEVINHGDPEPSLETTWKDCQGDTWSSSLTNDGWTYTGNRYGCDWNEINPAYFPMVRVS